MNGESRQKSTLQLWTLPAGASEGLHVHGGKDAHRSLAAVLTPLEEIYVCLSGKGSIPVQDSDGHVHDIPLQEGDAVLAPAAIWHGVSSVGPEPLRLLILWGAPHSHSHLEGT
mmetsp:Transcript_75474/g.166998  ORF Transcript_75474/g.166998 Transcript_75474/m.166998 type:complete len:113 (+) Transcript_75474:713-1051(+)